MVNILISPLQLMNGTTMGDGCDAPHYVADVFLMSVVLFFGTFIISVQLKDFKNALFFPSKVSNSRYSTNRILNI
jgi:sodium bicarbonate transporter 10